MALSFRAIQRSKRGAQNLWLCKGIPMFHCETRTGAQSLAAYIIVCCSVRKVFRQPIYQMWWKTCGCQLQHKILPLALRALICLAVAGFDSAVRAVRPWQSVSHCLA